MINNKPTTEREAATALARDWIEYAPTVGAVSAIDLLGFSGPENLFLCAHCAGRLFARGCSLNRIATNPVWVGASPEACILSDTHNPNA